MKDRLNTLAAPCAKHTDFVRVTYNAVVKLVIVGSFCLPSVFNTTTFAQGQTITVSVLEFQDESGAGERSAVAQEIARKLVQKLNAAYKDVLARHSNTAKDASSIQAMTVEQLGALGKQQGVQFVIRGGLLPPGEGDSSGEMKASIQLYADIVSVETLSTKSVRTAGDSVEKDQGLSSAIEQLAESIHQAIVSPASEPAVVDESPQNAVGETTQPDDSAGVNAAEADEELQQLISQAESLVADGSSVSGERLASLSKALESLNAALEAKATLLEEGKDATTADQEIAQQKNILKDALSSLAESEMPGAADIPGEQEEQVEQPSGEKKSLLARIDGYAGATLSIMQKIQEMRAAFRGATGDSDQTETSGSDSTEEAPASTEEAPSATEESTEEISGVITEMGEPVAGVTVTEPESGAKAETDSNGSYALEGVPAGRLAKLVVTKSGKQMATGQIDVARGRKSIADFELKKQTAGASKPALRILPSTVRLAPARKGDGNVGVLKGVVKDAQGRPAARALVRVGRATARTDSQGRYAFLNVPPGAHKIMVQRSGSKPKTEMVQVAAQKSSESKIQFAPVDKIANVRNRQTLIVRGKGNVLRGVVFDPQKRPLAGAKVTVVQQTSAVSVLAGTRGNYLLRDLRPGTYRVLVSKAGYVPTAQAVNVSAGEMQPRDFQLRKTDSTFIERALAGRRSNQNRSAGDPGKTDQRLNRQDQPRGDKVTSAKQPFLVEARVGRLRGRVSDSRSGKPVSGATISILGRRRAKSDDEGNYSVLDAPAGSFQITVSRAGFAEQERNVRVLPGNSTQENFVLVADNSVDKRIEARRAPLPTAGAEIRKGQLSGRIVDAKTGRPVSGAFVLVAGRRTVMSDRDGSYAFNDLAPGPYRVIARKSEFLDIIASLIVRAGETTRANLRLNPKPLNRVR
ncbi:MAG: carboxypeptidase regulatory-like domain-containing protein [Pyrinomonadaceae bacterium]|nr:carboxypeptidase regulatory-like domain-containing protein [Pyrinomonadaceae bacterium]